jgi:DNA-binding transcriptional regulator YiaG
MPLRAAHRVVTRIAGGEQVPLVLAKVADPRKLVAALAALGVAATPRRVPASVDVKKIRDKLGLSQAEFAARFCFDIRTLQNWEQGRSTPDRYARTLLRTIARDPAAVEATLAETG